MPPDLPESSYVRVWLQNARSDLALAKVPKTRSINYSHLCFHAQQAAEKSIKAVFLARRVAMPRTHDLGFLLAQLPKDITVPPGMIDAPTLTRFAVQQRYPGPFPRVTRRDHRHAVALAEEVLAWAVRLVHDQSKDAGK